ncbi:hypothetical protein GCM10027416_12500 [Okibacterium endophyticum]
MPKMPGTTSATIIVPRTDCRPPDALERGAKTSRRADDTQRRRRGADRETDSSAWLGWFGWGARAESVPTRCCAEAGVDGEAGADVNTADASESDARAVRTERRVCGAAGVVGAFG